MKERRITALTAALALIVLLGVPTLTMADETLKAVLTSYQEVSTLSTTGRGEFQAKINEDETEIDYELSYSDLEGGNSTAAHIHLGRPGVNGGVIAFLCGGGDKPPCPPATGGTVIGTIDAAAVIGPAAQGIAAGEIDELIAAMRAHATYVNVHNATYPGGEIRGAVTKGKRTGKD